MNFDHRDDMHRKFMGLPYRGALEVHGKISFFVTK